MLKYGRSGLKGGKKLATGIGMVARGHDCLSGKTLELWAPVRQIPTCTPGKSQKEYVVKRGTVFALSGINDAYTDDRETYLGVRGPEAFHA